MPRFFVGSESVENEYITVSGEDVKHITKVLRMTVGEKLELCDCQGRDYTAEISEISDVVKCRIIESRRSDTEPDIYVTLYQALPKASKMEYIIQKTCELGISRIVPVITERCVVKIDSQKDAAKKCERWQKISESAAKQSGRGIIPEISMPMKLKDAVLEMKKSDIAIAAYEAEKNRNLKGVLTSAENVKTASILIGPEGGFEPGEIKLAEENGIPAVTLGKRILRTETAGEAVLAMLMYEIGDINI